MDFSLTAFKKSVLHSLKHSSDDCIGVLIGNGESIIDAIPLFHEGTVGATLDAAFHMIQIYYLQPNPSYKIAGVYEASVSAKEDKFMPITLRILETVKEMQVVKPYLIKISNQEDEDKIEPQLSISAYVYDGDNKTSSYHTFECKYTLDDISDSLT